MKQSIFEKEYTVSGKNGTFKALVKVTMNYTTKPIKGTHAVTHDDFTKDIPLHKVETIINGQMWKEVKELESEERVLFETQKARNEANSRIQTLANEEPAKTFLDKMNEILS